MMDISFRYGDSHDQHYRTDTPATGYSATRISLASLSCLTRPGCLTSLSCLVVLGVLYSISAILVFAFLVVAVCPYLFCFVRLDYCGTLSDVSNGILISFCCIVRVMVVYIHVAISFT